MIVAESELHHPLERLQCAAPVAQLQQYLAIAGEGVLVVGIETEGLLEGAPRPSVFLACEVRVGEADVELAGPGVPCQPFAQKGDRVVVAAFVVELMGLFVEVVGAAKCFRHRQGLRAVGELRQAMMRTVPEQAASYSSPIDGYS